MECVNVSSMVRTREFPLKRLLFVVTEDWYFVSHRLYMATVAVKAGYKVALLSKTSKYQELIEESGIEVINWSLNRRSRNLISEFKAFREISAVIDRFKPDIVHSVALKPILYTALQLKRKNTYANIYALGGLGFVFSSSKLKAQILRSLLVVILRWVLGGERVRVILQNPDDFNLLLRLKVITNNKTRLIRGVGVDTNLFSPSPKLHDKPIVLLPARILWDKGIADFVEIANRMKSYEINVRFVLVGDPDPHNPESVSILQLEEWIKKGVIEWWGHKEEMQNIYQQATIVCLPSYREGLPKSLLEAASCALPIVTYDVPGCREVVIDGINGFLVPLKDENALLNAIKKLLDDASLCDKFGQAGRELVIRKFSQQKIASETKKIWEEVLS